MHMISRMKRFDCFIYRKQNRTLENIGGGEITLSEADLEEINQGIASIEVKGDRYYGADEKDMHLWG
jgi:pyridoxine 4-dehydrogenase